ncbi:hypothetical protein OVA24_00720 [Luteolibacter sp. SL250]|uniref:hypothetical protein n=1 Tax=Luteolibacter sp. SL250 TaxID=2995170 RepID=UPI00226EA115|nr:hypothetical protein [Luteolibacter sp. SL250]WAC19899.1 hypothetical protein OVA24_00720 [Luteolibacter sp. SL250]
MRPSIQSAASAIVALVSVGCNSRNNVSREIAKWEQKGWKYEETVGTDRTDAVYVAHLTSATADSAKAFSITNDGNRASKIYRQDSMQYLIVTMAHEAHGNFSLVFSKPKTP